MLKDRYFLVGNDSKEEAEGGNWFDHPNLGDTPL